MIYFFIMIVLCFTYLMNSLVDILYPKQIVTGRTYNDFIFFLITVVFFILFLGLRGLTGTDTVTYQYYYQSDLYPENMELLYLYFSRFFSYHGAPFELFQIFIALFTIFPVFIQYWKKSKNIYFTTLLFYLFSFYLYSFNVSRQTLAAAIIAFAFLNLSNKKLFSFVFSIILMITAIEIHKTSLYIIFFYFLIEFIVRKKFNSKKSLLILGILGIFFSFFFYKSNLVFDKLSSVAISFSDYNTYLDASTAYTVLTNKSIYTLVFALMSSLIIIVYSLYPTEYKNAKLFSPFLLFTILEILQVNWISDRMSIFTLPLIPLFISHLIYFKSVEDKKKLGLLRLLIALLGIGMGGLMFARIVIQNFGQISPYLG